MNRRDLIKSSLLTAGALGRQFGTAAGKRCDARQPAAHVAADPNGAQRRQMPNILWICPDMQRFDTIEGLNNDVIHTPEPAQADGGVSDSDAYLRAESRLLPFAGQFFDGPLSAHHGPARAGAAHSAR